MFTFIKPQLHLSHWSVVLDFDFVMSNPWIFPMLTFGVISFSSSISVSLALALYPDQTLLFCWTPYLQLIVTVKTFVQGGADKSLARTGRKHATAIKLGIYSAYSPRSSIHFLACCSNFCKSVKKNSERCPSNQVSAAAMTSVLDKKWRPFNCFFSPGNRW